jgi:hypothetical protein
MRSPVLFRVLGVSLVLGACAVAACDGGSAATPASPPVVVPPSAEAGPLPGDAAADVSPSDASLSDAADAEPPKPTFGNVYGLFERKCAGCHITSQAASGGLAMPTRAAAYAALVGVDCVEAACAGRKRVVANDPAASVLYTKIERTAPLCGGPMPPQPEVALSPAEVTLVRDWIMAGAPND